MLYTYGVRGGQVRTLKMEDIRWADNQILFRASKNGKDSLLPLSVEVGQSLITYLRHARPRCPHPQVFLTCRAPYHPLTHSGTLSAIVERHIRAAGIDAPSKGAHAFRHGFATRMVKKGHSLKQVADVLGHRHLSTTFIYTKYLPFKPAAGVYGGCARAAAAWFTASTYLSHAAGACI
jgi:integrase